MPMGIMKSCALKRLLNFVPVSSISRKCCAPPPALCSGIGAHQMSIPLYPLSTKVASRRYGKSTVRPVSAIIRAEM